MYSIICSCGSFYKEMEIDKHKFSFEELNELYALKPIKCCDKGFYIEYAYNLKKEKYFMHG